MEPVPGQEEYDAARGKEALSLLGKMIARRIRASKVVDQGVNKLFLISNESPSERKPVDNSVTTDTPQTV